MSIQTTEPNIVKPGRNDEGVCNNLEEGPMIQKDVLGCGGRLDLKCTGGCLKILKVLYSCEMKEQAIKEQMDRVKAICENKENCVVTASRDMFGTKECPDSGDEHMFLWVTYQCDGGVDSTLVTGPRKCSKYNNSVKLP